MTGATTGDAATGPLSGVRVLDLTTLHAVEHLWETAAAPQE